MGVRRRVKLVPDNCVEVFEIRVALYYNPAGEAIVTTDISTPSGEESPALVHEVLGVLRRAESIIEDDYDGVPR